MATFSTDQLLPVAINITNAAGNPAPVEGLPVWASSDETVVTVINIAADGMSAQVNSVAPNALDGSGNPIPVRITVQADANLDPGATTNITGVSEDIIVTLGTAGQASVISFTFAPPVDKNPTP